MHRLALVVAASLAVITGASAARADGASTASAELLFQEARKLMTAGKVEEACAKFAESQRMGPAAGTALNLGQCYEKLGRTASAWGAYKEAVALANTSAQKDREKFASKRANVLEPTLMKLSISVPQAVADTPGLEVKRDGVVVTRAQFGTAVPVDPGEHVVEATATDKNPSTQKVNVSGAGSTTTVSLTPLEDAPKPVVEAPPPPPAPAKPLGPVKRGPLPIVGVAAMVVGAGLIGTGIFFGLDASSKQEEVEAVSQGRGIWGPDKADLYSSGEDSATMANVFIITGGVVMAAGAALAIMGFTGGRRTETTGLYVRPRPMGLSCAF